MWCYGQGPAPWGWAALVGVLALPFISCVNLDECIQPSVPQFTYLNIRHDDNKCLSNRVALKIKIIHAKPSHCAGT